MKIGGEIGGEIGAKIDTQIGTEIAVLIYFRRDLARILSTWFVSLRRPEVRGSIDARMGWYVIIGTLPIAILGFTFAPVIETAARNLWLVATVLIVFGIVLGLVDRWGAKTKALEALNRQSKRPHRHKNEHAGAR